MAPSITIIACGALYQELRAVTTHWPVVPRIYCVPAALHNHPHLIAPRLEQFLTRYPPTPQHTVLVAYADCGSYGAIAQVCARFGVAHLAGEHCYAFYAGSDWFAHQHAQDPTCFYLTDFLVIHFDRTVMAGLGLDKHPQLRDVYFAHYTGVVYLQQNKERDLHIQAQQCAAKIGLPLKKMVHTGYGALNHLEQLMPLSTKT